MGKKIVLLGFLFTFLFGSIAYAHPGRTDSSGGHTAEQTVVAGDLVLGSTTIITGLVQHPVAVLQVRVQI